MSFDYSFVHARAVFLDHGPAPSTGRSLPGYSQTTDAAWECLLGHARHRMEDGTVMVPDSLGRWHRLSPSHRSFSDDSLTACAFDDDGGCAIVSPSLTHALVSASFGIWCHPRFEPWVGNPGRVTLPQVASGVPLGFEQMVSGSGDEPDESAMLKARREWLDQAKREMCPVRSAMAISTAHHAVRWIWAHEVGHLLGGHHLIDIGGRADVNMRFAEALDVPSPRTQPELALEILADRFATRLIATGAKNAPVANLRASAIGGLLALSLFEAEQIISGKPWVTSTHPGTWFRALSLLEEIEASAGHSLDMLPMLVRLAQALGHCGLWLTPAIDGSYQGLADGFVEDTLANLGPYAATLRAQGASPLRDGSGASADRYCATAS